jgi:parallel beta-helix repeat protein
MGVAVQGNLIGTNVAGNGAVPNAAGGVVIVDAPGNLVGAAGATAGGSCQGGIGCNVIAGNGTVGVSVTESVPGSAILNVIEGNFIGVASNGTSALPNSTGVAVAASNTVIGGTGGGDGNVIDAGSFADGVDVTTPNNQILGNRIGTDSLGVAPLGSANGVHLVVGPNTVGGSTGTTPGGMCTGACNVISGNSTGVQIDATASGVLVQGNFIGIDTGGSTAVPNSGGVFVNGSSNTIGGTAPGQGNVISGNSANGVTIDQASVSDPLPTGNLVEGNRIGTTPDGATPLGNALQGVALFDATGNTIGGTQKTTPGGACTGACNVISASGARGIEIANADTTNNVIAGNFIGLDATGKVIAGFANGDNSGGPGIRVETGATGTVIGGKKASARNVISGNSGEGIDLEGATKAKVLGNFIGTDTTGTVDLGNGEAGSIHEPGVTVFGGSGTTIGGKGGAGNVISGNGEAGVVIDGTAKSTKVQGNLIGTKANGTGALGNTGEGIDVVDGTKSTIGGGAGLGNTIRFNGAAGIAIETGNGNAIRGNSISDNGALGIDLDPAGVNANDAKDPDGGANLRQNYPVITSAVSGGGSIVIQGTFNSTPSASGFTLEFFASPSCDASGYGEGRTFLGVLSAVATNASGNASWSVTLPLTVSPGSAITATATSSSKNTSEFSACRTST